MPRYEEFLIDNISTDIPVAMIFGCDGWVTLNYLDVNIITSQSLLYRSKMPYTQKIEDVRIWFKNPEVKGKDIFVLDADEDYLKQRYGISLPHKNMKEVYRTTSGTIVYHLK